MRFDYIPYWQDGAAPTAGRVSHIDLEGFRDDDAIALQIARRGTFYEDDLLEHLALRGPVGGVFVDIGANIGNHSVFFGKFLADHVVAVEPNGAVIPVLRRNMYANAVAGFTLLPVALGAENGRGELHLPLRHRDNIGGMQVAVTPAALSGAGQHTGDEIRVTTLDEVVTGLAPALASAISLVKIDVEGMELAVLQGGRLLLSQARPQIIVELATPEAYERTAAFLRAYGYSDIGKQFGQTATFHFIIEGCHRLRNTDRSTTAEQWAREVEAVESHLKRVLPPCSEFILVDEDQYATNGTFAGGHAFPFTEHDDAWNGLPLNDEQAIAELERLRARGASFVVFVPQTFWWLEHFKGLTQYLRTRFTCVLAADRLIVFGLQGPPAGQPL